MTGRSGTYLVMTWEIIGNIPERNWIQREYHGKGTGSYKIHRIQLGSITGAVRKYHGRIVFATGTPQWYCGNSTGVYRECSDTKQTYGNSYIPDTSTHDSFRYPYTVRIFRTAYELLPFGSFFFFGTEKPGRTRIVSDAGGLTLYIIDTDAAGS